MTVNTTQSFKILWDGVKADKNGLSPKRCTDSTAEKVISHKIFPWESVRERILKIGQNLSNLQCSLSFKMDNYGTIR